MDVSNKNAIIISGMRPYAVINENGAPTVVPYNLPELPFINAGSFQLAPFIAGDAMPCLITMWQEFDNVDMSGPKAAQKQTIVGIYHESPDLESVPGSLLSYKKIRADTTVHAAVEIVPHTDDRTEAALLRRKTFVFSCSHEIKSPFLPNVLTQEEMVIEGEGAERNFDRFFLNLESFAQPSIKVGAPPPSVSRQHKIALVQGGAAVSQYMMPEGEKVLGIEVLYLNVDAPPPPASLLLLGVPPKHEKIRRVFVAACTGITDKHGEDTQGFGRLLLFALDYAIFGDAGTASASSSSSSSSSSTDNIETEIAEQKSYQEGSIDENGNIVFSQAPRVLSAAQQKFFNSLLPKLRLVWEGKQGPASVVKQLGGDFVLSTVGNIVYVYKFNQETLSLDQVSFYFGKFYISSVTIVKNFIMIADVCHSVEFLYWREEDKSLSFLSRDFDSCVCLSTSLIFDGSHLGMLLGDDEGNVELLQFNPKKIESRQGTRLLGLADFHVGSDVRLMLSRVALGIPINMPSSLLIDAGNQTTRSILDVKHGRPLPEAKVTFGSRLDKGSSARTVTLVGTMDGSIGALVPVDPEIYRRLALLQELMSVGVPTPCALNPREYRVIKTSRVKVEKKRGILDGNLLWKFATLETSLQNELVAAMGTTADIIIENLQEIDLALHFF